jgi:phosphatidylserine synthase
MFSRINLSRIFIDHLKTFYIYRPRNPSPPIEGIQVFFFFGIPVVAAACLVWKGIFFSQTLQGAILSALTLLAGLLLNLLAIAQSMINGFSDTTVSKIIYRSLRDTCANISYGILASLVAILLTIMLAMVTTKSYTMAFHGALYAVLINLALTLCMILNRMHILTMRQAQGKIDGAISEEV